MDQGQTSSRGGGQRGIQRERERERERERMRERERERMRERESVKSRERSIGELLFNGLRNEKPISIFNLYHAMRAEETNERYIRKFSKLINTLPHFNQR